MAIYYIDPHTTTNGTGTWASPWSLSSSTRTGLASNDEIRIKGVALTSLLTATSYTATVTNNYQLTITAGGGLGADWVAGNIGYLPAFDTFFKVYSVTTNVIQVYTTTSMLPINNWSTTSLTVRRVDTTTYPVSTTADYSIGSGSALTGITVSDCWTDATTRVTDGSVKTLFNTSATSSIVLYLDYAGTSSTLTNWQVNLQNTHVMCPRGTSSGYVNVYINSKSATYNINQIYSWGVSSNGIILGSGVTDTTINITTFNNYSGIGITPFKNKNNTLSITNLITYNTDLFNTLSANGGGANSPDNTLNITNYSYNILSNSSLINNFNSCKFTLNITGIIDQYSSSAPTYVTTGYGDMTINIGSGVVAYYNKRASTKSSWLNYCSYTAAAAYGVKIVFPTINISNGWTATLVYNITNVLPYTTGVLLTRNVLPSIVNIEFPINSIDTIQPYNMYGNVNELISFRDGSAPFELLGIFGSGLYSSNVATSFPKVTTDSSVYNTTGPSLKSLLTTRTAAAWTSTSKAIKTIKIPCTSGTSYTVSGYIRTDDSAYVNGDCRVGIYLNDSEVTGQNMTTSCINAWEQFTLTFTASTTGEYVLGWGMYYANGAKSYWLDDLTIA